MEIKYLGHSSFLIRNKKVKIVTDPFDPQMIGLKFPKVEADVITVSHQHQDHNFVSAVKSPLRVAEKEQLIIDLPGEYEVNGVRIIGYPSFHDKKKGEERGENTLFKFEMENITILHCGDIGLVPGDDFIEELGAIDILMVPVGGFYTIDAEEAVKLVRKIEPSIIIPMHYNDKRLNQKVFGKIASLGEFLRKIDAGDAQPIPKLTVTKEEMEGEMKVVTLLSG